MFWGVGKYPHSYEESEKEGYKETVPVERAFVGEMFYRKIAKTYGRKLREKHD